MARQVVPSGVRARLRQAVRDHHLAFMVDLFGATAVDPDDYRRLVGAGLVREVAPHDPVEVFQSVGVRHGAEQSGLVSPGDRGRSLHFDDHDLARVVRDRMINRVRELGNRLEDTVDQAVTDAEDSARRRSLAGLAVRSPAEEVKHVGAAVTDRLREVVDDLRREWFRFIHTEAHNVVEEAKATEIARRVGGDPRVFKRPRPDACAYCKLLYLRPDGVTPRVFRLSAIVSSGTNTGRRAGRPTRSGKSRTEWKPVVGSVHPFCQCRLHVLPDDAGFDVGGNVAFVGVRKSSAIDVDVIDGVVSADPVTHKCRCHE